MPVTAPGVYQYRMEDIIYAWNTQCARIGLQRAVRLELSDAVFSRMALWTYGWKWGDQCRRAYVPFAMRLVDVTIVGMLRSVAPSVRLPIGRRGG